MKRLLCIMLVFFGISKQVVLADVPKTVNYQGRLTDTEGNAVTDGTYGVTFTLFYQTTGNTPTGWSEVQNVSTRRGYFNVALGTYTPLNSLDFNYPYYLEIHVGGDAQPMSPRQPITSVPYALNVADGMVTTAKIANRAVTDSVLTTSGGTVFNSASQSLPLDSASLTATAAGIMCIWGRGLLSGSAGDFFTQPHLRIDYTDGTGPHSIEVDALDAYVPNNYTLPYYLQYRMPVDAGVLYTVWLRARTLTTNYVGQSSQHSLMIINYYK